MYVTSNIHIYMSKITFHTLRQNCTVEMDNEFDIQMKTSFLLVMHDQGKAYLPHHWVPLNVKLF